MKLKSLFFVLMFTVGTASSFAASALPANDVKLELATTASTEVTQMLEYVDGCRTVIRTTTTTTYFLGFEISSKTVTESVTICD